MTALRRHIVGQSWLAAFIVAAALMMRILVPGGFMPDFSKGKIEIGLCTGYGPAKTMIEMPGMTHGKSEQNRHDKSEMPCGFSGLSAPGLAGADPIQLALALLFIIATALFAAPAFTIRRTVRLRPPSRGPPATA